MGGLARWSRRQFLARCCQSASAAVLPVAFRRFNFPHSPSLTPHVFAFADEEFRLHPAYHAKPSLDRTLLKTKAGSDDFITEKYHDQIASVFGEWRASLLRSPRDLGAIEKNLAPEFVGGALVPTQARLVRNGPPLTVHKNDFDPQAALQREEFLKQWASIAAAFSTIVTAEFQVTSIEASENSSLRFPERLQTRVRYELVGAGSGFFREQRVGYWNLEWKNYSGRFRIFRWQTTEETHSRSAAPMFADIAAFAFGGNWSYEEQLLHGIDYWRTTLDAACGIDIYGHNGVSVADIDEDGFDDLYVCQPAGLPNRLYRNRGDGTFEDITDSSGLGLLDNTSCALFADFENKGRQDVVVVTANGPLLFQNLGAGNFQRKPNAFKFATPPQGSFTGAAVADYDCDGWLDIYFCLYSYYQGSGQYRYPVPYQDAENGPPNFMMRNERDGTFRDVTAESGLNQNNTRYSFCCGLCDFDGDGRPDLFVVNDFGRKNLYRNQGNGKFIDVASQAGVEDIGAGMSVCWFDYDNDGKQDLYIGDMWTAAGERISSQKIFKKDSPETIRSQFRKHAMGNSLLQNRGDSFRDVTAAAQVGIGRWAWSCDAFDFDHDGFADLYIANGMVSSTSGEELNSFFWRQVVGNSPDRAKYSSDYEQGWNAINELIRADRSWSGQERNILYANNRDGTFSDVSGAAGLDFIEDARSFAVADFNHDGRQEIFLKNRSSPQLRILQNGIGDLPPSIIFRLRGTKSNRDAIGAEVTIESDSGRQTGILQAGSGFLSQHSKEIFFGLGDAKGPLRATIRWPSGIVQTLAELPMNHRIWVEEGSNGFRSEAFKTRTKMMDGAGLESADTTGEQLPRTVETWLLTPVAAPEFSLADLNGKSWTLGDFPGPATLLNFWVTQSVARERDLDYFEQFQARWRTQGFRLLTVNADDPSSGQQLREFVRERTYSFPILRGSADVLAIYNLLYRYLFDRHRDLALPTSFLINAKREIVKIYQGPLDFGQVERDFHSIPASDSERLARGLPFAGNSESFDFARNYLSYGSIFFERGYFDQAAKSFEQALASDNSSAEAAYGLGSAYLNLGKTSEAREGFERATKLRAGYPDTLSNAWNNLGLLATRGNRSEDAIKCFREAVRLGPDHLIPLNNLGNAYRLSKDWDAAQQVFEYALEVAPTDAEANYGLAMVFAHADDTAHAYEYLQRALKSRPDYPEAMNNLGILYLRTQRRDDAVRSFEECIRVAPEFDQAYVNLARVYAIENTPDKARQILLELLRQQPNHAGAKNMLRDLPQ